MSNMISLNKVKARHFHSTKRFIDDLCALNDGGEFGRSSPDIYPEELDLKLEHNGDHGTFLNLDITIQDGIFVYKLYDKRDCFPFSIVKMPYIDSNIPRTIFYSALKGEFLRIARSTLYLEDFIPKAKELLGRMRIQGAKNNITAKSIKRMIVKHPQSFQQFSISEDQTLFMLNE